MYNTLPLVLWLRSLWFAWFGKKEAKHHCWYRAPKNIEYFHFNDLNAFLAILAGIVADLAN